MSKIPLTNEQLKQQAPALFTEEPHYNTSDKYHFIKSIDVVNEIKANNWYPVSVSEASVRDTDKEGQILMDAAKAISRRLGYTGEDL